MINANEQIMDLYLDEDEIIYTFDNTEVEEEILPF